MIIIPCGRYELLLGTTHGSSCHADILSKLVYQSTVFLSRSSISIGLPALPSRLLSLPAILQAGILLTLTFESAVGFFPVESNGLSIVFVFLLVSLEGICGGLA